jgi:hypothetical protein
MTKPHDAVIGAMAKMQADGYNRVSASELAHVLDIPVSEVMAYLRDSGFVTVNLRGEDYVRLEKVFFSNLPKPDSPILREVD